jgi:signal transduction histidine kinase/ligand-binding sensor domain-containing protein
MKKILIPFLLISILYKLSYCNTPDLTFSHLTTEEGLSNNTVHCIFQDSRGFLWFGTDDGLNIYDGYEFKTFYNNANDSLSIAGNAVFKITEDSRGQLWIGTNSGIDIYNRDFMCFEHIPFLQENNDLSYQEYVRDIVEDNSGDIIVVTGSDIFSYDTTRSVLTRYLDDIGEYSSFQKEGLRFYLKDKKNRVWIGSNAFGLFAYDLANNKVIASPLADGPFKITDKVFTVIENVNGDIWLGTDNGIYVVKSDLSGMHDFRTGDDNKSISSNNVISFFIDCKDRMWVGTDGGGLNLYNSRDNTFSHYKADESNNLALNNNSVRSIMEDRQGILWLGTWQGGVNYTLLHISKQIMHYKNEPGNPNSLIYDAVSAIYEDRKGNIWVGTDGGGLDCYNPATGQYKHYVYSQGMKNTINGNSILTITEDKSGIIYIGGYLSGINFIDPETGIITGYKHDPADRRSIADNDVRDICIDKNNNIWIATNGGGMDRFSIESRTFIHHKQGGANSIVSNWCLTLFEDSHGYIWIGTYEGISIFDPTDNNFRNRVKTNNPGSLSNDWIYCFAEDSMENMWIGTANGLNRYDRNTGEFKVYTKADGLPNNVINGILIDSLQNLWLSTNKGISRFNPVSGNIKNYDISDGLQDDQFIHGSYFKNRQGKMYFGGIKGFNSFYPDSIKDNMFRPPVYITNLLINFKEVPVDEEGSPLRRSITETGRIKFTHKQSVITFRYTALNYLNPAKNKYAYQLEGFDKDWNYVGTRREVTFTNLDPGSYTFRVKASNNDGVWNKEGTSISVVIMPPWWKTTIFKIGVILFVVVLALAIYLYRVRELKRQKDYLEKQVRERIKEIEEKNDILIQQTNELNETNTLLEERQQQIEEQTERLETQKEKLEYANSHLTQLNSTKDKFFSIIAHDLKNPFNTILGFSELLSTKYQRLSEEKKLKYSEVIYDSSRNIYSLLENLLQWARTQTDKIAFEPIVFDLKQIVDQNIMLLKENLTDKKITINHNIKDECKVYADRNMINAVIRNILTNAIKFTNINGEILIKSIEKNGVIEVSIKDNGIGMSEEEIGKLFRVDVNFSRSGTGGETGTGLGLILCKEFVEKNGGSIRVESKPQEGSNFLFTLPSA